MLSSQLDSYVPLNSHKDNFVLEKNYSILGVCRQFGAETDKKNVLQILKKNIVVDNEDILLAYINRLYINFKDHTLSSAILLDHLGMC